MNPSYRYRYHRRTVAFLVLWCSLTLLGFQAQTDAPLTRKIDEPRMKREYGRSMWHWNTQAHISDASRRRDLLDFCKREDVTILWMQVFLEDSPPQATVIGTATKIKGALKNKAEWRSFIATAHRAGVRVEALDGAPEYAVRQNHSLPLAVVDSVIAYNRESRPEERFDGIHFDNEPYLLIGWRDWKMREQILRDFLELNQEIQKRVRQQSNMVYGVDIPS